MRITGTIMTMITTHIVHHRMPFSPAFIAATRIGMVWALVVERNSASTYSFQDRISTRSVVAARPALASGSTISKKIVKREAPSSCALSSRSIGMLAKKSCISQTTIGRLTTV